MTSSANHHKNAIQKKPPAFDSATDIPPAIARRAVEWLIEWQAADEPNAVWDSILGWREANSQHEKAWQHIEKINKKFGKIAGAGHSAVAHTTLASPAISRRDTLKMLSVLAVTAGSAGWVYRNQPWQEWRADYHTGIGEQQRITLIDNTEIILNSSSVVDVQFNATERRVVLVKGEMYVKTGKGRDTPFVLQVPQGELRPLGTRFSAHDTGDSCRVAVYDGQVQVTPNIGQQTVKSAIVINAGQALTFTPHGWSPVMMVSEAEAAWTQGMIVVSNIPLGDFLSELNRHRVGVIHCAPSIKNLKVSGTYPLNQADDVLHALSQVLPIKLQSFTRYLVRVTPDESHTS